MPSASFKKKNGRFPKNASVAAARVLVHGVRSDAMRGREAVGEVRLQQRARTPSSHQPCQHNPRWDSSAILPTRRPCSASAAAGAGHKFHGLGWLRCWREDALSNPGALSSERMPPEPNQGLCVIITPITTPSHDYELLNERERERESLPSRTPSSDDYELLNALTLSRINGDLYCRWSMGSSIGLGALHCARHSSSCHHNQVTHPEPISLFLLSQPTCSICPRPFIPFVTSDTLPTCPFCHE